MTNSTETEGVGPADTMTNGDVFENLMTGDRVLWDGIQKPVTVTAGYFQAKEQVEELENLERPTTVFLEGPRGGEKMLIQNREDRDSVRVSSLSLGSNGSEWVSNLRIVDQAER